MHRHLRFFVVQHACMKFCGAFLQHMFAIADAEVEVLRRAGDGPGEDIQQIQGGDGVEIGEDGVYPDDPKHAGAQDHDDGGHHAAADAAGGGDAGVHPRGHHEGEAHDPQTLHARVDDLRLVGEDGQELPSEQQQQAARHAAHDGGIEHADAVALQNAVVVARAPVAAAEGGAGGVEGGHHVEDQGIGVGGGGVAGHHHRVEGVDAHLHEQVGDGKDGVLQAGGDADGQYPAAGLHVEPELPPFQAALILPPHQMQHDQQGGQPLGDDAGRGHAIRRHVALDHEEQVQYHV